MLLSVITTGAENLKVMYINHGKVWADGKLLKLGDIISSESKIQWGDNNQVIKVVDIDSHKVSVIPAKTLITGKMTSLAELLTQKQRLSSRDGILMNIQSMIDYFNQPIALMNSLCLEIGILIDDTHFFFIQYNHEGEVINKRLPVEGHRLCLNDEIFKIDGVPFPPVSLTTKLCYYEVEEQRITTIADQLTIKIEPRIICTEFLQPYLHEDYSRDELVEMLKDYCHIQFPNCLFDSTDLENFCIHLQENR